VARVVVVHGIGQQTEGGLTLHDRFFSALADGVVRGGGFVQPQDVVFASYGDLFREQAEVLSPVPYFDADEVEEGYESELLLAWWQRAADVDSRVVPPGEEVLARAPVWASRALAAMSRARFLAGVSDRLLIGNLKQVHRYFTYPGLRSEIRSAVADSIANDTKVVVAHSLGSVVAYEVLCAAPEPVSPGLSLVTLGSPLGLPNLVFDRLQPEPRPRGGGVRGHWPGPVQAWTNIADEGDVVAAVEDLRPLFGDQVRQIRVHNGSHAHDMRPYLTESMTGAAIVAGLNA
jgi:hypothetical protein